MKIINNVSNHMPETFNNKCAIHMKLADWLHSEKCVIDIKCTVKTDCLDLEMP